MARPITGTLTIQLSADPVPAPGYSPDVVLAHFWQRLEKHLLKRGWQAVRATDSQPAAALVRLEFKPGNRWMRYFLPFSSPAVVTALGTIMRPDGSVDGHIRARSAAHFGLLGGSAEGMLKVSADRAAATIAKQLGAAPKRGFEPIMPG